jgi:hypothetical protein
VRRRQQGRHSRTITPYQRLMLVTDAGQWRGDC